MGERLSGGGLRDAEKRGWRQSEQKKDRWSHRNSREGRGVENKRAEHRRCLERGEVRRDSRKGVGVRGRAEEPHRGSREKVQKDTCARKGKRGSRRNRKELLLQKKDNKYLCRPPC